MNERESVADIFERAIGLPPEELASYLDAACGAAGPVRARVESMLDSVERATGWLHDLADRAGLSGLHDEPAELPPDTSIGPYRLVRLIGRGGMGAVYLAERADEHFHKQVALKVLPMGMRDEEMRRRFLAERQILARLVHPHIAALLDGGITEDGTPYFVMEHVEGLALDVHCDRHELGVDARLDLFLQVCDAVAHAHRSLVVHRDLKPSNVLVDADHRVKLLDFGIAKVLDEESEHTRAGVRPMTPLYAAPEVLRGEAVTTATDVYSLGVLLYELVVGASPYGRRPASDTEWLRIVCEEEAPSPSAWAMQSPEGATEDPQVRARRRGTTPHALRERLRGDLDTIAGMALRKDPDARYRSVDELAADLRRHREDLPVHARPLTLNYRMRKFVRRHRAPVIASAVAVLMALTVTVLGVVHVVTTTRQARQIAIERDHAEQIRDFLVDTFLNSDPNVSRGEEITARELLDRGAARIETALGGVPQSQAMMMSTMADVYITLALYDEARPLVERAISLHEERQSTDSRDFAHLVHQAAMVEEQTGHFDAARAFAERAIALWKTIDDFEALAISTILLGRVHQREGDFETASIHLQEGVHLLREHADVETETMATALTNLASLHQQQGDLEQAEPMHREALRIRRVVYTGDHLKLMESLYSLGGIARRLGRLDEAQAHYEEALALTARLVPEGYPDDAYLHNGLGFLHLDRGELAPAADRFERALALSRRFLGDRHPNVGIVLANLAQVRLRQGRIEEACPLLEESLSILLETAPGHPKVASVQADLARCGGALDEG